MIKDTKIEAKQTSTGIWYCSNLPADNVRELDSLIGDVNQVLNKYNNNKEKTKTTVKKPDVKGLE